MVSNSARIPLPRRDMAADLAAAYTRDCQQEVADLTEDGFVALLTDDTRLSWYGTRRLDLSLSLRGSKPSRPSTCLRRGGRIG